MLAEVSATGGSVLRGVTGGALSGAIMGSGAGIIAAAFTGAEAVLASIGVSMAANAANQVVSMGKVNVSEVLVAAVVGPIGMSYGQMFRGTGEVIHEIAAWVSFMSVELASSFIHDKIKNSFVKTNKDSMKYSGAFVPQKGSILAQPSHGSTNRNFGGGQSEFTHSTSYGTGGAH